MSEPKVTYVNKARVIKVVDGDTLRLDVDVGYTMRCQRDVRLSRVDTPEIRGSESVAGKYVHDRVREFLESSEYVTIESKEYSTGKYGRNLCEVWSDGKCLNQWLLDMRYGWPTGEGGRMEMPRNVEWLDLPDGVKRKWLEELQK